MPLRDLALSDNRMILNDSLGFRWPITVTDPSGLVSDGLFGFSNDVAEIIDPDTGVAVSGRQVSVALHIADLTAQGFTALPRGIPDTSSKPWLVQFDDINGNSITFKVKRSNPDRALGMITLVLGEYTT